VAWYTETFGRDYLELYAHRDREEAVRDIDGAEKLIGLTREMPILDLACGSGRHSLELAARGYKVTGLDLSEELLGVARSEAETAGLEITFVRCDIRRIPFEERFGAVLNFFTSFGYFEKEDDNSEVLRGIYRSLVPGGRFLIDHLNREYVRANLVPEDVREEGGRRIAQRRSYDEGRSRVEKRIEIEEGGRKRVFRESVRLYSPEEFMRICDQAGLKVTSFYGGLDGAEFGPESERLVVIGERSR
jgi:SAM-dependent methyltransferase